MPAVRCKACNIVVRSTFFRCLICHPSYDFCRRCFESPSNKTYHDMSHPFVSGEANTFPVEWKSAVPPVDRTQTFSILQSRELTENDYTILLGLDASNVPPLHRHLVQGLKKTNPILMRSQRNIEKCAICNSSLMIDNSLRLLPCGNNCCVHESCAMNIFVEAQSSGTGKIPAVCCPICNDGVPLFPALKRQPKRRKPSVSTQIVAEAENIESALESFGGAGLNSLMLTGSIFSSTAALPVSAAPTVTAATNTAVVRPNVTTDVRTTSRPPRPRRSLSTPPNGDDDDLGTTLTTSALRRSDSAPTSLTAGRVRMRQAPPLRARRIRHSPVTITRALRDAGNSNNNDVLHVGGGSPSADAGSSRRRTELALRSKQMKREMMAQAAHKRRMENLGGQTNEEQLTTSLTTFSLKM